MESVKLAACLMCDGDKRPSSPPSSACVPAVKFLLIFTLPSKPEIRCNSVLLSEISVVKIICWYSFEIVKYLGSIPCISSSYYRAGSFGVML